MIACSESGQQEVPFSFCSDFFAVFGEAAAMYSEPRLQQTAFSFCYVCSLVWGEAGVEAGTLTHLLVL